MTAEAFVAFVLRAALVVAAGFFLARAEHPTRKLLPLLATAHLLGSASLAVGVTIGLAAGGKARMAWAAGALAVLAGAGFALRRRSAPTMAPPGERSRADAWLGVLLMAAIGGALLRLAVLPLGGDGWSNWQLKAKALALGNLDALFSSGFYAINLLYPLLVPVHTWVLAGGAFDPKLGQLASFLFFLDLAAIVYDEARARLSRRWALAGCTAVVTCGPALQHAASGYADVTMAAYAFAAAAAVARRRVATGSLLAAGAVLTKQEGIFTLAALPLIGLLAALEAGRWDALRRRAVALLLAGPGLAGGLALAAWHLARRRLGAYGAEYDLGRIDAVDLVRRARAVGAGFVEQAWPALGPPAGWGLLWVLIAAGLVLTMLQRVRTPLPFWVLAASHAGGALMAYLTTPYDVIWHVATSLDRLMLHVAPPATLAALIAFHGLAAPRAFEERAAEVERPQACRAG